MTATTAYENHWSPLLKVFGPDGAGAFDLFGFGKHRKDYLQAKPTKIMRYKHRETGKEICLGNDGRSYRCKWMQTRNGSGWGFVPIPLIEAIKEVIGED